MQPCGSPVFIDTAKNRFEQAQIQHSRGKSCEIGGSYHADFAYYNFFGRVTFVKNPVCAILIIREIFRGLVEFASILRLYLMPCLL